MTTPQFILVYRLVTVAVTLAVLLLFALGNFGIGPLAGLIGPSAPKIGI
jgi:type IV secretory pathway TrbL component